MEALLACLIGLLFAAAFYLMLSGVLVRFAFGLTLIGNAVNLLIFATGRLEYFHPPLIAEGQISLNIPASNALPQALILTAIVIGFAMVTFFLVLLNGTYARTGTLDADDSPFLDETGDGSPHQAAETQTGERDPS